MEFTIEQLKEKFEHSISRSWHVNDSSDPDYFGHDEIGDYTAIVKMVADIILELHADSYQGDSILFLQEHGSKRYGYLTYGWGSCSGCDTLLAISKWSELQEFANWFIASIRWFDTPEEAIDFFQNHDWKGDWLWGIYEKEISVFVEQAIGYITSRLNK